MKTKHIPPPITPETTGKNARAWLSIARYGESGTVIQLQDDCEYRVKEILDDARLLKSILGPYYKKYLLAYVTIEPQNLLESIRTTLLDLAASHKLGTRGTLTQLTNTELLKEIGAQGYEVGLFLSPLAPLITKIPHQSLIALESLVRMSKNLSIIAFSEIDITHPQYAKLADKCSFLFDHIIAYPLYEETDVKQFLLHYGTQWHFSLPEKTISDIVYASGGQLWLAHQLFRYLRDNRESSLEMAYEDPALVTKLSSIWEKLDTHQQEILRKVHFQTLNHTEIVSHEYAYLLAARLIRKTPETVALGIPLLSLVITRELALSQWTIQSDMIYIGKKDVTSLFTKKEKLVLRLLVQSKKILVSRDVIASALWADASEEKYSDWAIDRLIFRIRKKLTTITPGREFISAVKKKGFIFK
jgi:DNA-binding winged helix-turn-helix (wHTH) protein